MSDGTSKIPAGKSLVSLNSTISTVVLAVSFLKIILFQSHIFVFSPKKLNS
jgi:hypothetical protein